MLLGQLHQHPNLWFGEGAALGITVLILLVGAGLAFFWYAGTTKARQAIEAETKLQQPNAGGFLGMAYRAIYNKFYVDEVYQTTIVRPVQQLSRDGLWPFDQFVIDGLVGLVGRLVHLASRFLSWAQSGSSQRGSR